MAIIYECDMCKHQTKQKKDITTVSLQVHTDKGVCTIGDILTHKDVCKPCLQKVVNLLNGDK